MTRYLTYLLLVYSLITLIFCDEDPDNPYVTFGSIIKVRHLKSKYRLHSHDIKYGSGSGQQTVTGFKSPGDTNSYWIVMAEMGEIGEPGTIVESGMTIRLQHVNTGKFLHSHLPRSPLSGNLEVSCYDGTDTGDNWKVLLTKGTKMKKKSSFRLKHVDTGHFLYTNTRWKYRNPIAGQLEVSCIKSERDKFVYWVAEEGMYRESLEEENSEL